MEAAVYPDWSALPEELTALVLRVLDILDLFRAGAACTSWYAAYSAARRVRIPIKDASPCLLYSCADDDADTATLYSPSGGAAFKVRLPAPAFRSHHVVGSGHGWVITADEKSNLQLLNPLTTAQLDLPPVTGLHHVDSFADEQGRTMYRLYGEDPWRPDYAMPYKPKELRLFLYHRAYLSCRPPAGAACVVLLLCQPDGELSFARLGDDRWTHIAKSQFVQRGSGYRGAAYNDKDGLFYLVSFDSSVHTLDLNGPTPVVKCIVKQYSQDDDPIRSVILAPWGDMLQVWRYAELRCSEDLKVSEQIANEVIGPGQESFTCDLELYKVDINYQKLVKISGLELQEYALFLGFSSPMSLPTKDFPTFKPNSVYITEDSSENIYINKYGCGEVGIWNFETGNLESFGTIQSAHPRLNWPPPVWITPYLS
ncbi:unnamed protein product [Urochloa decumbens]|uniref:KIB1-4 beta-propeller domain-containing protein n=1 Tax=Urochloa decumbens TaxID=240449 RepID=A0ABC9GUB5_9POAL